MLKKKTILISKIIDILMCNLNNDNVMLLKVPNFVNLTI